MTDQNNDLNPDMAEGPRSGAAQLDAEHLGRMHGLHSSPTRPTMLMWLNEASYGQAGPSDPAAIALRPRATEYHELIRSLVSTAQQATSFNDDLFPGVLPLVCADLFGADRAEEVLWAIERLVGAPEREAPLATTAKLTEYLVTPVVRDWWRYNGTSSATDVAALSRDSLAGRWRIPSEMVNNAARDASRRDDPDCDV